MQRVFVVVLVGPVTFETIFFFEKQNASFSGQCSFRFPIFRGLRFSFEHTLKVEKITAVAIAGTNFKPADGKVDLIVVKQAQMLTRSDGESDCDS